MSTIPEVRRPPRSVDKFSVEAGFIVVPMLQIYAADHCTQRCQFCTTSSPHRRAHEGRVHRFVQYIRATYDEMVKFGHISILGGEPFLHEDLATFVRELRAGMPYYAKFTVTTNGFWLDKMQQYPSGLKAGDCILVSRYADIISAMGGVDRYQGLIEKLRSERPEKIDTIDAFFFGEWHFTEDALYGFPLDCDLADNISLSDDGVLYRCCIAPGASFNPRVTAAFLSHSRSLEYHLETGTEGLRDWLRSPLPRACGFCTAHYDTPFYPQRSLSTVGQQYVFRNGLNRELLTEGFHASEPTGVWTSKREAIITIDNLPDGPSRSPFITISAMVQAYLNSKITTMRVYVGVDGTDWKDRWEFPPPNVRAFDGNGDCAVLFIPVELAVARRPLRLRFSIEEPHSPFGDGVGEDERSLGLFFKSILVER